MIRCFICNVTLQQSPLYRSNSVTDKTSVFLCFSCLRIKYPALITRELALGWTLSHHFEMSLQRIYYNVRHDTLSYPQPKQKCNNQTSAFDNW